MEAKKDNVLRFPGRKIEESTPQQGRPSEPKNSKVSGVVVALSVILVASLAANRWTPDGERDLASNGRAIASVGEHALQPEERDPQWEKTMAKDLAGRTPRELASLRLGERPSLEDKLRFSVLKSQYSVLMNEGKLSEISWTESATENAIYITDRSRFITQFRDLLPMHFSTVVSEHRQEGQRETFETFALMNENQTKVGEVRFGLDRYGRLLNVVVASTSSQ